ncbi:MAG: DUF11 domain-containing protein [Phormidesmis sp.]
MVGPHIPAAYAEGSNDLVKNGGDRPYLEFRPKDFNTNIPRQTVIKVYAKAGEVINLGSSAVGIGAGKINYLRPNGTSGSCGTNGLIANRTQEQNGPGNADGFTPCTVTVQPGEGGIWEIDFVSPKESGGKEPPKTGGTSWTSPQPNDTNYVSAWDVTVKSSAGVAILGRVYANYYAFNMGKNSLSLSSLFYVLTQRGYRYRVDLNGLDPYGFIFFSNRNGFYDKTTSDPIFRSLQLVDPNPGFLPSNYTFQNPNAADSGPYVTNKTFINVPDPSMPSMANSPSGSTWLYNIPSAPPQPTNFKFEGEEGTVGQAGTNPLGGTFSFDSPLANSYSITLDLNNDGIYGSGNDRTLVGRADIGSNSIDWDGLDSNGAPVPASDAAYNVRINLYAGEAHFPMIDAEQNPNGIKILLENPPAGGSSSVNLADIYYDDRSTGTDYTVCDSTETTTHTDTKGCYGNGPTPRQALDGVDSSGGAHRFTNDFGDRRGIDTWVYFPSADLVVADMVVLKEADLVVDKTVDLASANPGDVLTYTVTVSNDGPNDEPGITFADVVPPELENVSWTCAISTDPGNCAVESGTGNNINTTLDLNNGSVATFTITGSIAWTASGSIGNEAEARRNKDITDPDLSNNRDNAVTTISSAPAAKVLIVKRITAINGQPSNPNDGTDLSRFVDDTVLPYAPDDNHPNWPVNYLLGELSAGAVKPGDELEYTVYFLSSGTLNASDVRLCDRLFPEQAFVTDAYGPGVAAQLRLGTGPVIDLTAARDGGDRAEIIPANSSVPITCNLQGLNDNGTLMIDITGANGTGNPQLTELPASTSAGNPNDAYGLFRFRTIVSP